MSLSIRVCACLQVTSRFSQTWTLVLSFSWKLDWCSHPLAVVLLVIMRTQDVCGRFPSSRLTWSPTLAATRSRKLIVVQRYCWAGVCPIEACWHEERDKIDIHSRCCFVKYVEEQAHGRHQVTRGLVVGGRCTPSGGGGG